MSGKSERETLRTVMSSLYDTVRDKLDPPIDRETFVSRMTEGVTSSLLQFAFTGQLRVPDPDDIKINPSATPKQRAMAEEGIRLLRSGISKMKKRGVKFGREP